MEDESEMSRGLTWLVWVESQKCAFNPMLMVCVAAQTVKPLLRNPTGVGALTVCFAALQIKGDLRNEVVDSVEHR